MSVHVIFCFDSVLFIVAPFLKPVPVKRNRFNHQIQHDLSNVYLFFQTCYELHTLHAAHYTVHTAHLSEYNYMTFSSLYSIIWRQPHTIQHMLCVYTAHSLKYKHIWVHISDWAEMWQGVQAAHDSGGALQPGDSTYLTIRAWWWLTDAEVGGKKARQVTS